MKTIKKVNIIKVYPEGTKTVEDQLTIERALAIFLIDLDHHEPYQLSITMRTPGHDDDIVLGFLHNEGIIKSMSDVQQLLQVAPDEVHVYLNYNYQDRNSQQQRKFLSSSSCGVCGKSSIEDAMQVNYLPITEDTIKLDDSIIYTLGDKMRQAQNDFDQTGALHAVGLFDIDGNLIEITEDIGRHNALDKMIGRQLKNDKLPLRDKIILLSGRVAYELVQKCLMAQVPVLAAIGAPSSLCVEIADKNNLTMIGFLRHDNFNLYTGNHRIQGR